MLGKDIAANLREHKSEWTTYRFIRRLFNRKGQHIIKPQYCVLGLKAHEAGISDYALEVANTSLNTNNNGKNNDLHDIWSINDHHVVVEDVIAEFDNDDNRDRDFPGVERFIELCKALEV